MEKKLFVILLVLVFLVCIVLGGVYVYFTNSSTFLNNISTTSTKVLATPSSQDSLGDFDPTVSSGVFRINAVDGPNRILDLTAIWPRGFEGAVVQSEITCSDDDIKIFTTTTEGSSPSAESVSKETLFTRLQNISLNTAFFTGTCSNTVCDEIKSECQLSINP